MLEVKEHLITVLDVLEWENLNVAQTNVTGLSHQFV